MYSTHNNLRGTSSWLDLLSPGEVSPSSGLQRCVESANNACCLGFGVASFGFRPRLQVLKSNSPQPKRSEVPSFPFGEVTHPALKWPPTYLKLAAFETDLYRRPGLQLLRICSEPEFGSPLFQTIAQGAQDSISKKLKCHNMRW